MKQRTVAQAAIAAIVVCSCVLSCMADGAAGAGGKGRRSIKEWSKLTDKDFRDLEDTWLDDEEEDPDDMVWGHTTTHTHTRTAAQRSAPRARPLLRWPLALTVFVVGCGRRARRLCGAAGLQMDEGRER